MVELEILRWKSLNLKECYKMSWELWLEMDYVLLEQGTKNWEMRL